ncbi:hypothetical protein [Flavobacterium eburneipallidum]|uniref:hypothetical protein n=1 Tax=Flavobacterium eburneipallidum TaxID=3003263 RepID=UPI0022AC08AD|nr:hypothetical protein [Flavobacterium eburneipallidum]
MKKLIFIFIAIQSFSMRADTITNWQLYKDNKILLKSNEFEKKSKIGIIYFNDNFKSLNFNIFYDFFGDKTFKKIEFIVENKIIQSVSVYDDVRLSFKIKKEKLNLLFGKYRNAEIILKYYDKINPKGIIIGRLKIKS